MKVAIITVSDRCSAGEALDASGPEIQQFCREQGWEVASLALVPDNLEQISQAIRLAVDENGTELVLTTGGTGLGPRDVTPEATLQCIDRLVPGIAEGLRIESLKLTPFAMLSRGVAGMRGKSLVVNLPGSPRAVRECLIILAPVLPHAIDTAHGGAH